MATLKQHNIIADSAEKRGFLNVLDVLCGRLENVLITIAGSMIIISMAITFIDVVMRYAFNSPLSWVFDFITMYLLPGCYFLAFSYALRTGNHLKVDYFKNKFPANFTKWCVSFFGLVASILFLYITYTYSGRAYSAWEENEVIYGAVNWLIWPSELIIAISSFTFSFRLIIKTMEQFIVGGGEL